MRTRVHDSSRRHSSRSAVACSVLTRVLGCSIASQASGATSAERKSNNFLIAAMLNAEPLLYATQHVKKKVSAEHVKKGLSFTSSLASWSKCVRPARSEERRVGKECVCT